MRTGHGLQGMRERSAMVGGTLRTGPAEGGGFLIEAELPTGERGEQAAT
jgi:signal transduction histidine kinase